MSLGTARDYVTPKRGYLGPTNLSTDTSLKLYRSDSSNNNNHYKTYFHITLSRNQSTLLPALTKDLSESYMFSQIFARSVDPCL